MALIIPILLLIGKGHNMGSNVEIITVCVATEANKFVGVSMYSDGYITFKPRCIVNKRATKLLRDCGHDVDVKGDVFIGRAFDDEREEWVRLDFTLSDMDESSAWVISTSKANVGRNMGAYRTSGAMKKIMQPNSSNSNDDSAGNGGVKAVEELDTGYLSWNQTSDEVEIRLLLSAENNAKNINVIITSTTLRITPKVPPSAGSEPSLLTVGSQFQTLSGASLFSRITKDESSWSIAIEDNMKVLTVTLAKADTLSWKHLLL